MCAHLHLNGTAAGHNTLALDATLHTIKQIESLMSVSVPYYCFTVHLSILENEGCTKYDRAAASVRTLTIMRASWMERWLSSMNCSLPPRSTMVAVCALFTSQRSEAEQKGQVWETAANHPL